MFAVAERRQIWVERSETAYTLLGDVANNYFFHRRKFLTFIVNMIVLVRTSGGLFAKTAKIIPNEVARM
jgi:hypothetical protein